MALTEKKIKGLRQLAKRGVGGERQNAIDILKKNGVPIEEPAAKPQGAQHTQTGGRDAGRSGFTDFADAGGFHNPNHDDIFVNWRDLEDMFRDFGSNARENNPPTSHKIEAVENWLHAMIVRSIAQKLFRGTNVSTQFNQKTETCLVSGLTDKQASLLVVVYRNNRERMVQAVESTLYNIDLKQK